MRAVKKVESDSDDNDLSADLSNDDEETESDEDDNEGTLLKYNVLCSFQYKLAIPNSLIVGQSTHSGHVLQPRLLSNI